MATIDENLQAIMNAVYGKDVRQAIHDSIQESYDDSQDAKSTVTSKLTEINTAISSAETATTDANSAASSANSAASAANTATNSANDAAEAARQAAAGVVTADLIKNALGFLPKNIPDSEQAGDVLVSKSDGSMEWSSVLVPLWSDGEGTELPLNTAVSLTDLAEDVSNFVALGIKYSSSLYAGIFWVTPDDTAYALIDKASSESGIPTLRTFGGAMSASGTGITFTARYGINLYCTSDTATPSLGRNGGTLTVTAVYGIR